VPATRSAPSLGPGVRALQIKTRFFRPEKLDFLQKNWSKLLLWKSENTKVPLRLILTSGPDLISMSGEGCDQMQGLRPVDWTLFFCSVPPSRKIPFRITGIIYCHYTLYLVIYLLRHLDKETTKWPFPPSSLPFPPSSQAATCCYQSNHSKHIKQDRSNHVKCLA